MKRALQFRRRYVSALRRYLANAEEAMLHQAYELGRQTIANGLGILDLAKVHHEALLPTLRSRTTPKRRKKTVQGAEVFFLEALSPFEAAHRGFREANFQLMCLNEKFQKRTRDLTTANHRLKAESILRRRVEEELLEISNHEQERIGQDLHDGLCQHLVCVAIVSKMLEQKLRAVSSPDANTAAEIGKLITQGIKQAHDLARGLYPVELKEKGLAAALQEFARNTESLFKIRCRFIGTPRFHRFDHSTATHVYRIAQEAVSNAIKHGRAKSLIIRFASKNGQANLEIRDDGTGIPEKLDSKQGMGLHTMNYRARLIGGTLRIQQANRRGTVVMCSVPLRDKRNP